MLPFIFILLSVVSAFAQQDVVRVIRIDEVLPLLSSLIHSGRTTIDEAAGHIVESVPMVGGNLKGVMSNGVSGIVEAIQSPLAGESTLMAAGKAIPVIGALLPSFNSLGELKQFPEVPTLAPFTPPEDAARMAADLGVKTAAVKNTMAALASIPSHAVAAGANGVASAFEETSNMVLGTPAQINQLLQFQHSLFDNYLAGMDQANAAIPPHTLRDELKSLTMIQPQLSGLMNQFHNPKATGALSALSTAFSGMHAAPEDVALSNVSESLLISPVAMKLAFANIASNFLDSIFSAEPGSSVERIASDA